MSLELLSAHQTDEGVSVTFGTDRGIEQLVGTADEIVSLARSMNRWPRLVS